MKPRGILFRAVGSFMNKFLRVTIMVLALNFMFTIMQTAILKYDGTFCVT